MSKHYSIPLTEIRREHVVVNSRFIATLAPVFSPEEARAFITRMKKEFADASHNVPAYIIGGGNTVTEFCSDGFPLVNGEVAVELDALWGHRKFSVVFL